MHELSIISALIETVERQVTAVSSGKRVLRVGISAGGLSCVSVEALRFGFDLLAPGTLLEGAALDVEEMRALCDCQACGAKSETDDCMAPCPACGSRDVRLDGGEDLLLQSIEIED